MAGLPKLCPESLTSLAFWIFHTLFTKPQPQMNPPNQIFCSFTPAADPSLRKWVTVQTNTGKMHRYLFQVNPFSAIHQISRATPSSIQPIVGQHRV